MDQRVGTRDCHRASINWEKMLHCFYARRGCRPEQQQQQHWQLMYGSALAMTHSYMPRNALQEVVCGQILRQ